MKNNAIRIREVALKFLAVALFGSSLMWGQFTSQIEGTVLDPSRAVVPSGTVTLLNVDTGVKATTQANSSGQYRFPNLPAATFKVTVTAAGFQTAEVASIRLDLDQTRTVDVTLKVGASTTAVTVNAEAAAVELSDARVSSVIQNAQMQSLPIAGNNILALTILSPGVIGTTQGTGSNTFSGQSTPGLNGAGTRTEQNGYGLDGSTVVSMVRNSYDNLTPNQESIEDVHVSVNDYSAESGRNAGTYVNALTKSGTNAYHGSLIFFHEDNILTARTLFQNTVNPLTGRVLPVSRRNEGGGSLGGPVIKNKMFLFGAFDILRQSNADGTLYTVETPQFAQWVEQNFPNNKSAYLMQNFAPNFTPTSSFKTAGSLLGGNCSTATTITFTGSTAQIPCTMNVLGAGVSPYTQEHAPLQFNFRWDYNISDKDRLYFQYYRDNSLDFTGNDVRTAFSYLTWYHNYMLTVDETHTFSPTLINEFKSYALRTAGLVQCKDCQIPTIGITGISSGYGIGGPTPFTQNNFYWLDNVTKSHGTHTIKAGVEFERLDANWNPGPSYERPGFSFTTIPTFVEDNPFSETNIGFNPTNGSVLQAAAAERYFRAEVFAQDTWKVTPHLTLTYGVRWSYNGRVAQATGGNNVEFPAGCTSFVNCLANGVNTPKHYVFDTTPMDLFSPRLGIAWDPFGDSKTSVRFGTGVYHDPLQSQVWGGQHYTPPLYAIVTEAQNAAAPLNQPLYAFGASGTDPYGFPRPAGLMAAVGLDSHNGSPLQASAITWDQENLGSPTTYSYFLGVQRSLTSTLTLEVNYVGNLGRHLFAQWDRNRYDGSILANNGVVGKFNNSFGTINYTCSCFNSSYTSGNVLLRQQAKHGLFVQAAYTWGHARDQADSFGGGLPVVDSYNTKNEWGNSGYDVSQKLALALVYQTPKLHQAFVNGVLGDWNFNMITVLQTGGRFQVTCSSPFAAVRNSAGVITGDSGCDYNADGTNNDRPMAPTFTPGSLNYSLNSLVSTGIWTASQFPAPCLGCNGNLGRNTFTNPGYANVDLSMQKIFALPWFLGDKKSSLLFRVDAFNSLNRVDLGGITADMANVNFGKVTSVGPARTFQVGAKFRF
jgi:hypothetical protein